MCQFNKFGFCKFRNNFFRKHKDNICENGQCEVRKFPLRHPKKCRFFVMYKNCKFGTFCRFNHVFIDVFKDSEEIEKIKKQLDEVKKEIMERDEKIDKLNKNLKERVDSLEKSNEEATCRN